jgi:hypothetical protein
MVLRRVEALRLSSAEKHLAVGEEYLGYSSEYPKIGSPFLFTTAQGRLCTSSVVRVLRDGNLYYVETVNSVYRISITLVD